MTTDKTENENLNIILEKLDKADSDREKILLELDDLSKVIAENRLKIVQLENRVDKLDDIADKEYPNLDKEEILRKVTSIEVNVRWTIGSIIFLMVLYFILIFNLIK